MSRVKLEDVLKKYSEHPDFLGVEINDPNQLGAIDDAVLHIAVRRANMEDIQALLENGADINLKGDLGNTPLHYAAMKGNTSIISFLLKYRAKKNILNDFDQLPVKVAELGGHLDAANLLKP